MRLTCKTKLHGNTQISIQSHEVAELVQHVATSRHQCLMVGGTDAKGTRSKTRSRILKSRSCNTANEMGHLRLWYKNTFRTIHCTGCKKHSRAKFWMCSCGSRWHDCPIHRVDPDIEYNYRAAPISACKEQPMQSSASSVPECADRKPKQRHNSILHGDIAMGMTRHHYINEVQLNAGKCPKLDAKCPNYFAGWGNADE